MDLFEILLMLLVSFSLSYLFVYPTLIFAKKFNLVDDVLKRIHPAHTHKGIVPRAGGLPIFLAILISVLLFLPMNKILFGVLLGGLLIVIMGLFDDYYDLSPILRFFLNILVALIVVSFGLGVPYISNPFGGVIRLDQIVIAFDFLGHHKFYLISNLFSIFWIVAIMNFINWSKGVDGQLPGFVAIASYFLGILAYRFSGHSIPAEDVAFLSFAVCGAYLGFLPWNFYPQKIMPGYGGGAMAGYFLAVLSILSWGKIGTMVLVLCIPIIDAIYVLLKRIKNAKSPFKGDASHLHHRLLEIGWGRRRIAFFYWFVTFLFGFAAIYFQGIQKVLILTLVIISLGFFITLMNSLKNK